MIRAIGNERSMRVEFRASAEQSYLVMYSIFKTGWKEKPRRSRTALCERYFRTNLHAIENFEKAEWTTNVGATSKAAMPI